MTTRIVLLLFAAALAGCASGPKYSEMKNSIPELNPERGRIYFYRSSALGAAVQPNILLNGVVVGEMVPRGFFFVDRSPGTYLASTRTESEATLQIPLAPNETRYVRGSISIGIFVGRPNLMLVEPRDAMVEIGDLGYTGAARATAVAPAPAPAPSTDGGTTRLKDLEGLLPDKGTEKK